MTTQMFESVDHVIYQDDSIRIEPLVCRKNGSVFICVFHGEGTIMIPKDMVYFTRDSLRKIALPENSEETFSNGLVEVYMAHGKICVADGSFHIWITPEELPNLRAGLSKANVYLTFCDNEVAPKKAASACGS